MSDGPGSAKVTVFFGAEDGACDPEDSGCFFKADFRGASGPGCLMTELARAVAECTDEFPETGILEGVDEGRGWRLEAPMFVDLYSTGWWVGTGTRDGPVVLVVLFVGAPEPVSLTRGRIPPRRENPGPRTGTLEGAALVAAVDRVEGSEGVWVCEMSDSKEDERDE